MYNAYHKKEDERLLLTPEMIFSHQKKKAVEDLPMSLGALVFFVLFWIADIVAICVKSDNEEADALLRAFATGNDKLISEMEAKYGNA